MHPGTISFHIEQPLKSITPASRIQYSSALLIEWFSVLALSPEPVDVQGAGRVYCCSGLRIGKSRRNTES
jgi:hypothetical protein